MLEKKDPVVQNSHSQQLQNLIRDRIENSPKQRITFAEYMDLVLYHPEYGYYSSGKVKIGSEGDFFTSPHLGKDFGELLSEQFLEMWEILSRPVPFLLVEMGAGQGLLAADILDYLQQNRPDFFEAIEYIIIEQAEGLRERQQKLLSRWKVRWKSWSEIPSGSIVGCCFSNELIDALPVHQITIEADKIQEIYVTTSKAGFEEIIAEPSTDRLEKYFDAIGVKLPDKSYLDGYRTEVNLAALDWLSTVAERLQTGYILTIDYGYTAKRYYHPERRAGTLQCYYQHRRHDNPYIFIGEQDITTHVDFTALECKGESSSCGLQKIGFTNQGMFLMALGLGNRLAELSSGKYDVRQILQRRDALHQLMDPSGVGGFGVLIQAKGLSEENVKKALKGLKEPQ